MMYGGKERTMGQQQLLLLVVGILVVTVAIAAGMLAFVENSVDANRQAMVGDLQRLATMAQGYYRRPAVMGGGAGSFDGLRLGLRNPNGVYALAAADDHEVVLVGMGKERGADGNFITMKMTVHPDTMMLAVRN
jgi:hypothetical protein